MLKIQYDKQSLAPSGESLSLFAHTIIHVIMQAGYVTPSVIETSAHIFGRNTKPGESGRRCAAQIMGGRWVPGPTSNGFTFTFKLNSKPRHPDA